MTTATKKTTVKKAADKDVTHKLRIRVRAYENKILDASVKQIIDTARRYDATIVGPIPLPTEIKKYTVNRASFVFKNAREQFEIRIHKRVIDILNPNKYDLDLSQWRLTIDGASFPFPKNTIILGGNTTRFSGVAMGFAGVGFSSSTIVKIMFPNLEEVTIFKPKKEEVLGVSTTTKYVTPSITVVKNIPKIMNKVSTVSNKPTTTSTTTPMKTTKTKDKRLVTWFKVLLGID